MHRITGDGFIVDAGKNLFADEDPPTRDATQVTHQWANAVQEEIATVVESTGATLHASSETYAEMSQLNLAIDSKIDTDVGVETAARTAQIAALTGSNITNNSSLSGAKVTDALNTQVGKNDTYEAAINTLDARLDVIEPAPWMLVGGVRHSSMIGVGNETKVEIANRGIIGFRIAGVLAKTVYAPPGPSYKDISATWVQGDGGGRALGVALTTDTWYYLIAILNTNGSVDYGFDTSSTGANLRAGAGSGWTGYRIVGAVHYDNVWGGGDIIREYYCLGNRTVLNPGVATAWTGLTTGVFTKQILNAPPGVVECELSIVPSATAIRRVSHGLFVTAPYLYNYYTTLAGGLVELVVNVVTDVNSNIWVFPDSTTTMTARLLGFKFIMDDTMIG